MTEFVSTDASAGARMSKWAFCMVFPLLTVLNFLLGPYNLCYIEQWHTYIYDGDYVTSQICRLNGFNDLLALFLVQFFVNPWLAVLVNGAVLTLVYQGFRRYLTVVGHGDTLLAAQLPLLLSCMCMAVQYSSNLNYSFTTSLLLVSLSLWVLSAAYNQGIRVALLLVLIPLLMIGAGPAALVVALMSVPLLLAGGLRYVAVPAVVWLISAIVVIRQALVMGWEQLATLKLYAVMGLEPSLLSYECWIALLLSTVWVMVPTLRSAGTKWVCVPLALASLLLGFFQRSASNETFMHLNYLSRHGDWDGILKVCRAYDHSNVMFHNYRNMALAEKGMLGDSIFSHVNVGLQSVFMSADKSHFVKGMLSDVFYSMGDISQAQQHAFETLEMTGNTSPKMLERLALTNLAWDNIDVELRYLRRMKRTLFYGGMADSIFSNPDRYRIVLPVADSVYGFPGLDEKLRMIVRHDPDNGKALQYLCCLYLLDRDLEKFMDVVREFYGKPCLESLPLGFQQAVVMMYPTDSDTLDRYGVSIDVRTQKFSQYEQYYKQRLR